MPLHADSLWDRLSLHSQSAARTLRDARTNFALSRLEGHCGLSQPPEQLRGRSVLIATQEQLNAALALIELDGIAGRLTLLPPGLSDAHLDTVLAIAQIEAVIVDRSQASEAAFGSAAIVQCGISSRPSPSAADRSVATEWVLLTSGTTGAPKLVSHTLSSLAGKTMQRPSALGAGSTWSTFYDIRRYGGLQILLRALLGGGSMVFSDPHESLGEFLDRASEADVTHLTGTPSHWRRLLMSQSAHRLTPAYVRLSGEIADQAILDHLRAAFPDARIAHAFASTEAGLGFEVTDGLAGFPAQFVHRPLAEVGVEVRIEDGSMLIRSPRTASRYLNADAPPLRREDGFVDTHDLVELRDDRYFFVGRRGGIINVGGLKCHPEEIESVINRHPMVQMSRAIARKNPVLGAVVVAEVVLKPAVDRAAPDDQTIKDEIVASCRQSLSAHKVPASVRIVASLEVSAAGKLQRSSA